MYWNVAKQFGGQELWRELLQVGVVQLTTDSQAWGPGSSWAMSHTGLVSIGPKPVKELCA